MNKSEIKSMLENLINYKNCEITHSIKDFDYSISLSYINEMKSFQIKDVNNGKTRYYSDIETSAMFLTQLIDKAETA